jgi:hypothetical protein
MRIGVFPVPLQKLFHSLPTPFWQRHSAKEAEMEKIIKQAEKEYYDAVARYRDAVARYRANDLSGKSPREYLEEVMAAYRKWQHYKSYRHK